LPGVRDVIRSSPWLPEISQRRFSPAEADNATWRKASYSGGNGGSCVEVAEAPHGVAVRDTTNRAGETLAFTADAWASFTASLK
jgi:hypothetical protein